MTESTGEDVCLHAHILFSNSEWTRAGIRGVSKTRAAAEEQDITRLQCRSKNRHEENKKKRCLPEVRKERFSGTILKTGC